MEGQTDHRVACESLATARWQFGVFFNMADKFSCFHYATSLFCPVQAAAAKIQEATSAE